MIAHIVSQVSIAKDSYNNEDKEIIEWVKFEECDLTDAGLQEDSSTTLPIFIILGYNRGVQVQFCAFCNDVRP